MGSRPAAAGMSTIERPAFRLVLVGVDGSDGAHRALRWTARLAQATAATVLAVHVLTYNREFARDLTLDTMRTWRRDLERDLEGAWTEPLRHAGVQHRSLLTEAGSPATGLVEVAESEGVDLLVVGAKGHGNLAGRVLGGVSYRTAHHASQPVVIVPAGWTPPSDT
jgi:nucleotide-binding universal stress UspA family protein